MVFCMSSLQAKTVAQTTSWLAKKFPSVTTAQDTNSYVFDGCSVSHEWAAHDNQDAILSSSIKIDSLNAKGVRQIVAANLPQTSHSEIEAYDIVFQQEAVKYRWEFWESGETKLSDKFSFKRKATSPDMPDRILKALNTLLELCSGARPKNLVNNIAKDDLF